MIKAIGEYVGGKVLTAILIVTGGAGLLYFYKHPEQWDALWSIVGRAATWVGIVAVVPWACFWATRWAVRRDSNAAGAIVLAAYLAVDVIAALLLAGVHGHGVLTWTVFIFGFLAAGVYNLVVCDYQADRLDQAGGL